MIAKIKTVETVGFPIKYKAVLFQSQIHEFLKQTMTLSTNINTNRNSLVET